MTSLYIALGGGIGSLLRFWLGTYVGGKAGAPFWGTLVINILGSFVIGICAGMRAGEFARHFVMIGVLGGFTTFSAFSLQTLELFQQGNTGTALVNIALSLGLCLLGVWLGHYVGKSLS